VQDDSVFHQLIDSWGDGLATVAHHGGVAQVVVAQVISHNLDNMRAWRRRHSLVRCHREKRSRHHQQERGHPSRSGPLFRPAGRGSADLTQNWSSALLHWKEYQYEYGCTQNQ
jgi:hypothetical protein